MAIVSNLCCDRNIYTINSVLIYGFFKLVLISLAVMTETFIKMFYQDSPMIFLTSTMGQSPGPHCLNPCI
jgi:hypothetical protein